MLAQRCPPTGPRCHTAGGPQGPEEPFGGGWAGGGRCVKSTGRATTVQRPRRRQRRGTWKGGGGGLCDGRSKASNKRSTFTYVAGLAVLQFWRNGGALPIPTAEGCITPPAMRCSPPISVRMTRLAQTPPWRPSPLLLCPRRFR